MVTTASFSASLCFKKELNVNEGLRQVRLKSALCADETSRSGNQARSLAYPVKRISYDT